MTATRLVGSLGLTVAMAVGVRGYVERNREHGDQHLGYVVLAKDVEGACRLLYIVGNSVVAADAYTSLLDRCVIRLARAYLENMYQIYICVYGCEPDNVFLRFARG